VTEPQSRQRKRYQIFGQPRPAAGLAPRWPRTS
jgi:hypothetical protein